MTKVDLNNLVVSMFINDIKIMTSKESRIIQCVKAELAAAFAIIDMDPISFYLGLKVEQDWAKHTIKLLQPVYINKVLFKFHLDQAHAVNTPIKKTTLLLPRIEGQELVAEKKKYQDMNGSIMFSMVKTRLDIAFAISVVSRFTKNFGHEHTKAVKTILQYLKGLREQEITYGG